MLLRSCLLARTLVIVGLAGLLKDFSKAGASASHSDCKGASIADVAETLEKYSECFHKMVTEGEKTSINLLAWRLQEMLNLLRPLQEKLCKPLALCPHPLAPRNGGLVCVTIDGLQYCKPMCNKGYDFQFLRKTRLYETCGNTTGFAWTTQYIGGDELAVCSPSEVAVSGAKSAYFPANSTCQHTIAFAEAEKEQINIFLQELREEGIDIGRQDHKADCIMCGY
ncbi:uncharacterized protein LOC112950480 [Nothoprocta perdicaria]|uniref:uncharacterized protein LOC112950480 n=1 Tax=Nothoprocta perdicaria TaxID=30464 RepID=UPI000E1B8E16|nr:uncharacterized protein LOC112950480 [Nothoprocta perdicaria]